MKPVCHKIYRTWFRLIDMPFPKNDISSAPNNNLWIFIGDMVTQFNEAK